MSRSFRHTPILKDNGRHKRFYKQQANKKVRKSDCSNGNFFKKVFDSWTVCDWKFWITNKDKKNLSK